MFLTKLKIATVVSLIVVVAGIEVVAHAPTAFGQGEPEPRPLKQERADGQAEKASNPGRIYVHFSGGAGAVLQSMEADGQGLKDLPRGMPKDEYYFQLLTAKLSPDGQRLAFGQGRLVANGVHPPSKILVRDVAKSSPADVLVDMGESELHRWIWSPDGTKIVFTSWDMQNRTRNWIVDTQTKQLDEVKTPLVQDAKHGDFRMAITSWSRDGKHFLAVGKGIHLLNRDGSLVRKLVDEVPVYDGECRFSPDGKKLFYVTFNKDHSNTLFVLNLAEGKPQAIVEAANFMSMHAVWSPDSRRIAYIATLMDANGKRGEETTLFLIDADGKNTTTLRSEKHDAQEIRLVLTDWR